MTATLLDALGYYIPTKTSHVLGVDLFLGRLPAEAPNAVMVVQQYTAEPPNFTFGPDVVAFDNPRVQVMVRGEPEDYPDAYAVAENIRQVLGAIVSTTTIDGVNIMRCAPMGVVNYIGYDTVNRPMFTVNFNTMVAP